MAKLTLTKKVIDEIQCPEGKSKLDLFDTGCKGLMLEVRPNGKKTYYLRYMGDRGRQKLIRIANSGDVSLPQARQLADKFRSQLAMGIDPKADKKTRREVMTFAEFIDQRYMPFIKGYKKSWGSDDSYLRNQILPALGKKFMDEITKKDIIDFHHGLKAKGYKPGTANRSLVILRYAFNLALRWEIPGIKANPSKDVALFDDFEGKHDRFLNQEETHKLFDSVKRSSNRMLQYIIPMLILTGARKREVLDAKWEDFDIDRRQWRIPICKTGRPRYVPLSNGVIGLLKSVPQRGNSPYVFANPETGKPYVSFFNSWDTARKKAGLGDVRIHDLRHSFASFLVNGGRSLYEVQAILGHSQIKTTQRYAHLSQDTLIAAADAAFNLIGKQPDHAQVGQLGYRAI